MYEELTADNNYLTAGLIYATLILLNIITHWIIKKKFSLLSIKTSKLNVLIYTIIYITMYGVLLFEYSRQV